MFNVSGTEFVALLVIGLVVLGPEKLPGVIRRVGQVYREIKHISDGFKQSVAEVVDEPLRELKETSAGIREAISRIPNADSDVSANPSDAGPNEPDPDQP